MSSANLDTATEPAAGPPAQEAIPDESAPVPYSPVAVPVVASAPDYQQAPPPQSVPDYEQMAQPAPMMAPAGGLSVVESGVFGVQTLPMPDGSLPQPSRLFYMDFFPRMLSVGDKKAKQHPTFEGFKMVFFNINQWLLNNPFRVLSVEHTKRAVDWDGTLEPDDTIFHTKEISGANWLVCTRVWLSVRDPNDIAPPDSLAYYTHKPMSQGVTEPENIPEIDTIIDLLNAQLKTNPLPGRIVSVETVEHAVDDNFKVTQLLSDEFGEDTYLEATERFQAVTFIRIIYAQGAPLWEEIGVADFAPEIAKVPSTGKGKTFFQPFRDIVQTANTWIGLHDARILRVTGLQICSLHVTNCTMKMAKLKKDGEKINTKSMYHMDSGHYFTSHIKFVRVMYTKLASPLQDRPPFQLSTKMLIAPKIEFQTGEPLPAVVGRANAWLACAGNQVMGAQLCNFEFTATASTVDIEEVCWTEDKKLRYFIQVLVYVYM